MTSDRSDDLRRTRKVRDVGSASVEAVVLAPVLVVLLLFVVHLGRFGAAHTRLTYAADHAARAASLVHPRAMVDVAHSSAVENLAANGLSCESVRVATDVENRSDPLQVRVTLECVLDRDALRLLTPLPRLVRATSTEVVDRWRTDS